MTSEKLVNCWESWFDSEVRMWVRWHEYWLERAKESKIPIYFFRFEDLLIQPEGVLKNMFKFILAKDNLDGTVIEQRIRDVISKGKNFLYKPRSAGGGFHKHAEKLTEQQMTHLKDKLEHLIHFFGYAKDELRPDEEQFVDKHTDLKF